MYKIPTRIFTALKCLARSFTEKSGRFEKIRHQAPRIKLSKKIQFGKQKQYFTIHTNGKHNYHSQRGLTSKWGGGANKLHG